MNNSRSKYLGNLGRQQHAAIEKRKRLEGSAPALLDACKEALEHISELEEAWRTGALSERDGKGGTRSNRNLDVRVILESAIKQSEATP
jgi:hypothetical protein